MSTTHLTQCPHCQATFKVQDQHLSAAGGKVRCGSCLEVFNALENLTKPDLTQPKPVPTTPVAPTPHAQDSAQDSAQELSSSSNTDIKSASHSTESDELLFDDNPDEDSGDESYSGAGTFSSELSDSFLELEEGGKSHFSDSELDDSLGESDNHKGSDESWAEQMLEDIETQTEQSPDTDLPPPTNPFLNVESPATPNDSINQAPLATATAPSAEHIKAEQSQRYSTSNASNQYQHLHVDPLDLPTSKRSTIGTIIWSTLNLLLLATLLAQLSWFHYDKLAQFKQLRPFYEKGCELIGCKLPDLVDTSLIKSQNLVVQSHPTARKALIIDAEIINQAPYDQPFPNLALYFSDLNNNIIAQRLFEPKDYLAGDIKNWKTMPKNTPIHISIEILDPGKNAVNYSVKFFKHSAQH